MVNPMWREGIIHQGNQTLKNPRYRCKSKSKSKSKKIVSIVGTL